MSKVKTLFRSLRNGTIVSLVKEKLFPTDPKIRIKERRIKYWTELTKKRLEALPSTTLQPNEIQQINAYWGGYNVNSVFHKFYKAATGKFDVRYIPDDIYYTYIDPYFNDWGLGAAMDNKTYYRLFFPNVPQPQTAGYRINGFWYDNNGCNISYDKLLDSLSDGNTYFVKAATNSMGGHGISVIDGRSDTKSVIRDKIDTILGDIVIQHALIQSDVTAKINSSSVNTIRVMTFLRKDGSVKICSTSLRMGMAGSKVDNASSGGITVGVDEHGHLNKIAYSPAGKSFNEHPTSKIKFEDVTLPNFNKVIALVKEEARKLPMFRLISWDIALDRNNEPVMIETNLFVGELEFHQLNNGPIFGDETDDILNEIKLNPKNINYPF